MKFIFFDNEWIMDRRIGNRRFVLDKTIDSEKRIDMRRNIDRIKLIGAGKFTISDAFVLLGIEFSTSVKKYSSILRVNGDFGANIDNVQAHASQVERDCYLLSFEDGSLVVYENRMIKLFYDSSSLDKSFNEVSNSLKLFGSKLGLIKVKVTM